MFDFSCIRPGLVGWKINDLKKSSVPSFKVANEKEALMGESEEEDINVILTLGPARLYVLDSGRKLGQPVKGQNFAIERYLYD